MFNAILQVCNVNPQYVDPNTGQAWPYCSDTCQAAANPQPQQALCTVCAIISSSYDKALKSILRSAKLVLNTLIRILARSIPTVPRRAGQPTMRINKHNTHSSSNHNNKVPHLSPLLYFPTHALPSSSDVQLPWLYSPRHFLPRWCRLELLQSVPPTVRQRVTPTSSTSQPHNHTASL